MLKIFKLTDFMTKLGTLIYQHSKTNVHGFIVVMFQDHNLEILCIMSKY